MKLKNLLLFLTLGCSSLSTMASELTLEHVANAGVKIISGEKIVLVAPAKVYGKIGAPSIKIEEGVVFDESFLCGIVVVMCVPVIELDLAETKEIEEELEKM